DELKVLFFEAVPGKNAVAVRDIDLLKFAVIEGRLIGAGHVLSAKEPVAIHGEHVTRGGRFKLGGNPEFGGLGEGRGGVLEQAETTDSGYTGLDEVPAIHVVFSFAAEVRRQHTVLGNECKRLHAHAIIALIPPEPCEDCLVPGTSGKQE